MVGDEMDRKNILVFLELDGDITIVEIVSVQGDFNEWRIPYQGIMNKEEGLEKLKWAEEIIAKLDFSRILYDVNQPAVTSLKQLLVEIRKQMVVLLLEDSLG